MARYKVLATSFIGSSIVNEGDVVEINDDVANGGMEPGSNLAKVDDEGEPEASKPARKGRKAAAVEDSGSDLA